MNKDKLKKCNSLQKSCDTLKEIVQNCNNPKFQHLDVWEAFQSKQFRTENYSKKSKKFLSYKRGTIVFVNFGTNIGNELSGNHFAIVLSKDDSPLNGNLTVIPLTSKNKKYNLDLGKDLIKSIIQDLTFQIDELIEFQNTLRDELYREYTENQRELNDYVPIHNQVIIDFFSKFVKKEPDKNGYINLSTKEIPELIQSRINDLKAIESFYISKVKDSYAMINSVTTISKFRIKKPINNSDPIGRIKISKENLDKIDIALIKKFTDFSI